MKTHLLGASSLGDITPRATGLTVNTSGNGANNGAVSSAVSRIVPPVQAPNFKRRGLQRKANDAPATSSFPPGGAKQDSSRAGEVPAPTANSSGGPPSPTPGISNNAEPPDSRAGPMKIDRKTLSIDMLKGGYVQSFVDFFYLTHRPDPSPEYTPGNPAPEIKVPETEMLWLRDQLSRAEKAQRKGDMMIVYENYYALSQYFQRNADHKTGIFFLNKCLEFALLLNDRQGEMSASHRLGKAYEQIGETAAAITYHEKHLAVTKQTCNEEEEIKAYAELMHVYQTQAEEFEKARDYKNAVTYHEKCIEAAKAAKNTQMEGDGGYRLGRAFVVLGEPEKAIQYLESYLSICKARNDVEGQGNAHSTLASAYQALQQIDAAVEHLEHFLQITVKTNNLVAQGEACCNLGSIYSQRGEFHKAVQMFEKNFEIARNSASAPGGRKLIDTARISLGIARANAQMRSYLDVVNSDLNALLKWKTSREAFLKVNPQ